jgi:crossover junction endodeoxyribonuclease RuvC
MKVPTPSGRDRKNTDRPKADRTVIGIDPGLASLGYGLISTDGIRIRYVAHGCIGTSSDLDIGSRLAIIYDGFMEILERYRPSEAGIEGIYFSKNITSALWVAEAKGVVTLALKKTGIPVFEYTPFAIKNAVVGHGRAEKRQVQELVRVLLGLNSVPKPDHAADALGTAICHCHWNSSSIPRR